MKGRNRKRNRRRKAMIGRTSPSYAYDAALRNAEIDQERLDEIRELRALAKLYKNPSFCWKYEAQAILLGKTAMTPRQAREAVQDIARKREPTIPRQAREVIQALVRKIKK